MQEPCVHTRPRHLFVPCVRVPWKFLCSKFCFSGEADERERERENTRAWGIFPQVSKCTAIFSSLNYITDLLNTLPSVGFQSPISDYVYTSTPIDNIKRICLVQVQYDLGQKYKAPQVRPDRGSNSQPPDHDSTLHVTETPALTTNH